MLSYNSSRNNQPFRAWSTKDRYVRSDRRRCRAAVAPRLHGLKRAGSLPLRRPNVAFAMALRWHLIVWSEHAGSWKKISMENSPLSSVDSTKLRESMARRLYRRSVVAGEITLPAVPGMIDEYVKMCDTIFAAVGARSPPSNSNTSGRYSSSNWPRPTPPSSVPTSSSRITRLRTF
jgi:hypothetical protein